MRTPLPGSPNLVTGADAATAAINALNCGEQIDTRNLSYITRIGQRRLLIVDEEYGLVFGFPMFVHRGGKIHEIEANGFLLPYGAPSGWE